MCHSIVCVPVVSLYSVDDCVIMYPTTGSIVSLLLEHRGNPLLKNKSDETPLQCAYNKNVSVVISIT